MASSARTWLWGVFSGLSLTATQGCGIITPSSHSYPNANPIVRSFAERSQSELKQRAISIAQQEIDQPKGFVVYNQNFAASKITFADTYNTGIAKKFSRMSLGFNFEDSTVFAKITDPTQPEPGSCSREATAFLGRYDDVPYQVQVMFGNAHQEAKNSKKTMPATEFRIIDSSKLFTRQHMGGSFIRQSVVDLKNETLDYPVCMFPDKASVAQKKREYRLNTKIVADSKRYLQQNDYRAAKRYASLKG